MPARRSRFKRVGDLQMPIDFTVTANDGHTFNFHIPNTWFTKQTNATVLPRWTGFGELDREYIAHVDIPTGIAEGADRPHATAWPMPTN
jgi:hypothetical protein